MWLSVSVILPILGKHLVIRQGYVFMTRKIYSHQRVSCCPNQENMLLSDIAMLPWLGKHMVIKQCHIVMTRTTCGHQTVILSSLGKHVVIGLCHVKMIRKTYGHQLCTASMASARPNGFHEGQKVPSPLLVTVYRAVSILKQNITVQVLFCLLKIKYLNCSCYNALNMSLQPTQLPSDRVIKIPSVSVSKFANCMYDVLPVNTVSSL